MGKNSLIELLDKFGILPGDLADEIGVSTRTIQYYCTGQRIPNVLTAIKIAQYFRTSVEDILW